MNKRKSILGAFLMVIAAAAFPSGQAATKSQAAAGDAPAIKLILAHGAPEGSVANNAALLFKKLIEERSGGKIIVENYPAFQLGSIMELDQNVKGGSISMIAGSIGGMTSRKISALDLPGTFTDINAARTVLKQGKFRGMVDTVVEGTNLKVVSGIIPVGYREVSTNVPIKSVTDFKGLGIRTMENPIHMTFWKSMGANPTPVAFSELYIALQQGLVKAQENPINTILTSKIYEQQKQIVLSHHVMFNNAFLMNLKLYNSLPDAYKTLIKQVFDEVDEFVFTESQKADQESLKKLQSKGLEVVQFNASDYSKMTELAKPVVDMVRKDCGDEMVDALLSELASAAKK